MYPLAHLYFVARVLGFRGDAAALGSIFPDSVISSGLEWDNSHSLAEILWKHFRGKGKQLEHFSLGVISHGTEPRGLDYFSDEKYKNYERGYCYEKARSLIDDVVDSCYIAPEDGWWKAHNFIEMSVELHLYQKDPSLLSDLRSALGNSSLITYISRKLEMPLGLNRKVLENSFTLFKGFAVEEDNIDTRVLALRFQNQHYFKHSIESIDLQKCQDLIKRGQKIIATDIEDFFEYAREQMKPVWKEYLG